MSWSILLHHAFLLLLLSTFLFDPFMLVYFVNDVTAALCCDSGHYCFSLDNDSLHARFCSVVNESY